MKLVRNTLLLLSAISLFSIPTIADPKTPTCDEVLNACNQVVEKSQRDRESLKEIIRIQDEALKAATKREAELMAQRDSILKNPILWTVVGAFTGLVVGVTISK